MGLKLLSVGRSASKVAPETVAPPPPKRPGAIARLIAARHARKVAFKLASNKGAKQAPADGEAKLPSLTLLMLGCDAAGKTTLAAALKGAPIHKPDPTIGYMTGSAVRCRSPLVLMDVGGGPNIRGIWSDYYASVHGAVFVIDAADSARFPEARALLAAAAVHEALRGKPLLVLANKQDHPHAVGPAELAEALRVHELEAFGAGACHVAGGCLAGARAIADGSELDHGLEWLLGKLQAEYQVLQARVDQQVAAQEEAARTRKEERKARLAAKRAARERDEAEAAAAQQQQQQPSSAAEGLQVASSTAPPTAGNGDGAGVVEVGRSQPAAALAL